MKKIFIFFVLAIVLMDIVFTIFFLSPKISLKNVLDDLELDDDIEEGFVTKVIDGDTIVVGGGSVRLLGIDADEKGYKCYESTKKRLEELVLNKEVILERDKKDLDQYKRKLRWLFVNIGGEDINVNLRLVEEGLAIARFYEDRKYREEILESEELARKRGIGCKWSK